MQHPRVDRLLKDVRRATRSSDERRGCLSANFASMEARYVEEWRARFSANGVVEFPLINPVTIIETAKSAPILAAHMCHQGCFLLGQGHRERLAEYLTAGYTVAQSFLGRPDQIERLAGDIIDNRTKSGVNPEKVKSKLLHYMFIFIFFQSRMTTRNRATQYAHALQGFFDADMPPAEVEQRLRKHGPERLYRAAGKRAELIRGAQEWAAEGRNPTVATLDEVLAKMDAEELANKSADAEDEITDLEPRELPPTDFGSEDESEEDWSNSEYELASEDLDANNDDDSEDERRAGDQVEASMRGSAVLNAQVETLVVMTLDVVAGLIDRHLSEQKILALIEKTITLGSEISKLRTGLKAE